MTTKQNNFNARNTILKIHKGLINLFLIRPILLLTSSTFDNVFHFDAHKMLKVQSCKLYKTKYIITSTQKIFAFMAVLVFKLLSRKVLFTNRKDNRNC